MKKILMIIITAAVMNTINTVLAANSASKPLILHSGPGNHYPIQAAITAGIPIRFGVCNPVWCHIYAGKLKGWVHTKAVAPRPEKFAYRYSNLGNRSFSSATGGNLKAGTLTIRLKIISLFKRKDRRNNR